MGTPFGTAAADRFYVSCALLISLVVFAEFARTYYLKFALGTPSLQWLLHAHGIVMTAWVVLFLTQVNLTSAHRVALHRRLGVAAAIRVARRDANAYPNSDYPLSFPALQLRITSRDRTRRLCAGVVPARRAILGFVPLSAFVGEKIDSHELGRSGDASTSNPSDLSRLSSPTIGLGDGSS